MRPARSPGEVLLHAAIAGVLALLTLLPTGRVTIAALAGGLAAFWTPASRVALWHTLVVGAGGTAVAGLLGGGLALLVGTTDVAGKRSIGAVFVLLMILPSQVTAIAWIALLGPSSPVLVPLGLAPAAGQPNPLYGPAGIAFLLGLEYAPLVFIVLRTGLRSLPEDAVRAARACGAGAWSTLWRVVLPLLRSSFLAGVALAFVSAIGTFGTPALLGIPGRYSTLPTLIYRQFAAFGPEGLGDAATLSLLLAGLALAGILVEAWAGRRTASLGRAGESTTLFQLGRWRPWVGALGWACPLALLAVPLAALAGAALVPAQGVPITLRSATLDNFRFALAVDPAVRRAFVNSATLSGAAALLLGGLAVPACYLAVWRRGRPIAWLLRAADLCYAMPGTVLALAAILLFIRPVLGVVLYDTLGILLVAYLARFLTLALRPVVAAMRLLDPMLEVAAQSSGAPLGARLRRVALPLLLPAALAGGLLVFLTAFNELTVSALLWSSGHETVGVVLFSLQQAGEAPLAAAVATISVAVTLALVLALTWLARVMPRFPLPWG